MQVKNFTLGLLVLLSVLAGGCTTEESAHEKMVNLNEVKDNPDALLQNLNEAIKLSKRDGSLYTRRAILLLKKGDLKKALEDADEAVRLTRNEPYTLFVKAQVLRAMKRPQEALPLAMQAERNSYQSSSLYILLGELFLQQKNYSQSKTYLDKAQQLVPNDEFVFYYKGRLAEMLGDTTKAVNNYRLALSQMPAFGEAHRDLGGIMLKRGDYATAQNHINKAHKQLKSDGVLWYYSGLLYQGVQKQDSAQLAFKKAIAISDTLLQAHYRLGLGAHARGENEIALTHLEKAYASFKNTTKYLSTLASTYERTGQPDKALQTYQRLIEIDPRYTYAYQAIARLKFKLSKPTTDSTNVVQDETVQ